MTRTLEQRVAALESGELERLRGLAARRLERLRQERAAVADLRDRLNTAANDLEELQWAEWHAVEARDVALAELRETERQLLDTRSHLKDALEELAEANAKLAKPTAPKPGDDSFNDDRLDVAMRELVQMAQKNRMPMSVWFSTAQERWCASDGQVWLYADSANNALMALWEHTK